MKFQLLPSTFEPDGTPSIRQHLTTMVVDDRIAFDAGSLAIACCDVQRSNIRDIVISHAHLDHIAGLPMFIDDLFATLEEPVCVHASPAAVAILEEHIFNWSVYPRFSELENDFGPVLRYQTFENGRKFAIGNYTVLPLEVNHKVESFGFVISDGRTTIATSGDTAPTDNFWRSVTELDGLDAVLVECAFPNELSDLAATSYHLTPSALALELAKLGQRDCRIYVSNIKPAYRDQTVSQLSALNIDGMEVLDVGRQYNW